MAGKSAAFWTLEIGLVSGLLTWFCCWLPVMFSVNGLNGAKCISANKYTFFLNTLVNVVRNE